MYRNSKRPFVERRQGMDRRRVDAPAPGAHERRRGIEPRRPEVTELELSESQWAELQVEALGRKAGD